MSKEILIDHKEIQNPQTITQTVVNKFKEQGLDVHMNEVRVLDDDYKKGVRKLEVVNTKYFSVGNIPWKK